MPGTKNIAVLYHANCPDGFGGAYAAWKKFGDTAEYRGLKHHEPPPSPQEFVGKEVYFVDFCSDLETMIGIENTASKLVVLDHHASAKEKVEQLKEHVFDNKRSGAAIAWQYFHPDTPLPRLLSHVQDIDLWQFKLPNTREVASFLSTVPFEFERWDKLVQEFEDEGKYKLYVDIGSRYREFFDHLCEELVAKAEEVEFDGHRIFAVNAPDRFASAVGNMLARKHPPFALVWYWEDGVLQCSLRGNGEVDLSALAAKHGGGGHHNAAGFHLPMDAPFPFTRVKL